MRSLLPALAALVAASWLPHSAQAHILLPSKHQETSTISTTSASQDHFLILLDESVSSWEAAARLVYTGVADQLPRPRHGRSLMLDADRSGAGAVTLTPGSTPEHTNSIMHARDSESSDQTEADGGTRQRSDTGAIVGGILGALAALVSVCAIANLIPVARRHFKRRSASRESDDPNLLPEHATYVPESQRFPRSDMLSCPYNLRLSLPSSHADLGIDTQANFGFAGSAGGGAGRLVPALVRSESGMRSSGAQTQLVGEGADRETAAGTSVLSSLRFARVSEEGEPDSGSERGRRAEKW